MTSNPGPQVRFHGASIAVHHDRSLEVGVVVYGSARARTRMWLKRAFMRGRSGRSLTVPVAVANADHVEA